MRFFNALKLNLKREEVIFMAVRPIFQDRILDTHEGSDTAQFDVSNQFLPLLNAVQQEGTFMTAGQMNNMVYFSNLAAFSGTECTIDASNRRNPKITIRESAPDGETGERRLIAEVELQEVERNRWTYSDKMYDTVLAYDEDAGETKTHHTMVQERRSEIVRNGRVLRVTVL